MASPVLRPRPSPPLSPPSPRGAHSPVRTSSRTSPSLKAAGPQAAQGLVLGGSQALLTPQSPYHTQPQSQAQPLLQAQDLRSSSLQALGQVPSQARRRRNSVPPTPASRSPPVRASIPSSDEASQPRYVTRAVAGAGAGAGAGSQVVRVAVGVPTVSDEAAALGAPDEDREEREFKQKWARTPRRICIFVEPSPFS